MNTTPVAQILATSSRPTLSLEFFPPKTLLDFGVLGSVIERMRPVRPDFVTCTYGAGGSSRDLSFAAWDLLARLDFTPVVAHLTCVGASCGDLVAQLHRIYAAGIRNVMALRGDPPRGQTAFKPHPEGLAHAVDLVRLAKLLHPDLCCGVAGYPETHPEALSPADDIQRLREKIDAGASFVHTQLFYSNDPFYRFRDAAAAAGVAVPIVPGLMPISSLAQLQRSVAFSRASIPPALADALSAAPTPKAAADAGMDWLIRQIDDLISHGVPGIHLYIMNRANALLDPRLSACLARWRA
jgi:methylenetetrahydrofolate reductase (NADPH)